MKIYLILITFLVIGCSTKKPSEYQLWSSTPTPAVWNEHSTWSIVMLDKKGTIVTTLTLKFTEDVAETCASGDYRKVKILSEYPKRSEKFTGGSAYEIKGSALIIDLSANLCDAGYELRGQISEIGIEGYHQPVTMLGGEVMGRFYGMPLQKQ